MSLPLLIDMNLSIEWVDFFRRHGREAVHWSKCGAPTADDATLMLWAAHHKRIVFTHDLDFGSALALTHAVEPSVIQVRGHRVLPEQIGGVVLAALAQYDAELTAGAIVVVEAGNSRVRILPF